MISSGELKRNRAELVDTRLDSARDVGGEPKENVSALLPDVEPTVEMLADLRRPRYISHDGVDRDNNIKPSSSSEFCTRERNQYGSRAETELSVQRTFSEAIALDSLKMDSTPSSISARSELVVEIQDKRDGACESSRITPPRTDCASFQSFAGLTRPTAHLSVG